MLPAPTKYIHPPNKQKMRNILLEVVYGDINRAPVRTTFAGHHFRVTYFAHNLNITLCFIKVIIKVAIYSIKYTFLCTSNIMSNLLDVGCPDNNILE